MRSHCLMWHSWRPRQVDNKTSQWWMIVVCDLCVWAPYSEMLHGYAWIPLVSNLVKALPREPKTVTSGMQLSLLTPTFVRLLLPWKDKKEPAVLLMLLLVACCLLLLQLLFYRLVVQWDFIKRKEAHQIYQELQRMEQIDMSCDQIRHHYCHESWE